MKLMKFLGAALILMGLSGCVSDTKIKEMLKNDPTILAEAIKANPTVILDALREAAQAAQAEQAKNRDKQMEDEMMKAIDNPLTPNIRADETIRGNKDAPIILVEYSDFECPYCARGFQTVEQLKKQYGDKLQFIYKHLPLDFHKFAMPSAQYYEAMRLQNEKVAFAFHDMLYKNPEMVKAGEKAYTDFAKKNGLNVAKLKKDAESEAVAKRIAEDMEEAKKFDMNGTPGFLINGVPVRGAYPASHFDMIIKKLVEKGRIKL